MVGFACWLGAGVRGVNGLFTVSSLVRGGVNEAHDEAFTPCPRGDDLASHHHRHVQGTPGDNWGQHRRLPHTIHTCIHTRLLTIPNGGSGKLMYRSVTVLLLANEQRHTVV